MKRILFICTGNTCRSPMAEALTNHYIQQNHQLKDKIKASSAGIFASESDRAAYASLQVMKKKGIDLMGHKSRRLTSKDLAKADVVLGMTGNHKESVLLMEPRMEGKVFTLPEYLGLENEKDIPDPFGQGQEIYQKTAKELEGFILQMIEKWKEETEEA